MRRGNVLSENSRTLTKSFPCITKNSTITADNKIIPYYALFCAPFSRSACLLSHISLLRFCEEEGKMLKNLRLIPFIQDLEVKNKILLIPLVITSPKLNKSKKVEKFTTILNIHLPFFTTLIFLKNKKLKVIFGGLSNFTNEIVNLKYWDSRRFDDKCSRMTWIHWIIFANEWDADIQISSSVQKYFHTYTDADMIKSSVSIPSWIQKDGHLGEAHIYKCNKLNWDPLRGEYVPSPSPSPPPLTSYPPSPSFPSSLSSFSPSSHPKSLIRCCGKSDSKMPPCFHLHPVLKHKSSFAADKSNKESMNFDFTFFPLKFSKQLMCCICIITARFMRGIIMNCKLRLFFMKTTLRGQNLVAGRLAREDAKEAREEGEEGTKIFFLSSSCILNITWPTGQIVKICSKVVSQKYEQGYCITDSSSICGTVVNENVFWHNKHRQHAR
ncbi:hypothetical protein EGR_07211 [Echinococcus granulosus]|uniref:Uncharacterized protein n=1 Tax=Echinococcus granulosus TaxID=6210 RepID=W6UBM6_ECHGR|nr:hypothetical protein EGR_07211 [Echinococcus granulosus]EUB57941.1 hypothetical protein EGR_07211 [Echinococcus granulosus]